MNSRDTYPILDLSSYTEDSVDPVEVNNFDEDDENQLYFWTRMHYELV